MTLFKELTLNSYHDDNVADMYSKAQQVIKIRRQGDYAFQVNIGSCLPIKVTKTPRDDAKSMERSYKLADPKTLIELLTCHHKLGPLALIGTIQ